MKTVVLVGGAIFSDGKLLIIQKSDYKKLFAWHWEIPGGKVDPGEDPNKAIIREVKEETNLDVEIIRPYDVWHSIIEFHDEKEHLIEIDFLLKAKTHDIKLEAHKHPKYKWITPDDTHELLMTSEMKATIMKAFEENKKS
jgi:8-oxo-dGTP diphosphatase